jgi:hypothetical protein
LQQKPAQDATIRRLGRKPFYRSHHIPILSAGPFPVGADPRSAQVRADTRVCPYKVESHSLTIIAHPFAVPVYWLLRL